MSYAFEEKTDQGIRVLQLKKGEEVVMEILPDHGGTLNVLKFEVQGKWVSTIYGYESRDEVPQFPGSRSAILFPFPNRLRKGTYKYQGIEYQFPTEEKHQGNAIHGFVRKEPFKLEHYEANAGGGEAKIAYYYGGDRRYYPFAFGLYVTFKYFADRLETHFSVENRGNTHMPVGLGWHPYFMLNRGNVSDWEMKLPFVSHVQLDGENLPTGEVADYHDFENFTSLADAQFDDCFKLIMQDKSALFSNADNVGLLLEHSPEFLFLQVYIPGDRQSIALEPMNCNVDAFNNQEGLMDLEKGSFFDTQFTVRLLTPEVYHEMRQAQDS
ncbi:MAG: aldose 1-epimerase [Bacteroidota bacterium]